jgi:ADP-heptose:LPS heptosyltransferase
MSIYPIYKKIGRIAQSIAKLPIVFIKRAHARTISFLCGVLSDPHWLLDYMPGTSYRRKTVLIVRLDLIGDFILWLDSAKELKKVYPASHLVLYGNSVWTEVARQLPYWDEVIPIDVARLRTDLLYRIRIFFHIRRKSFDIALQPTFSREYVGDLTVRASKARQRIGHRGDINNITELQKYRTDLWYTQLIDTRAADSGMELQTNTNLINGLSLHKYRTNTPSLPVLCTLPKDLIGFDRYTVIAPGASWRPRAWPIEYFAALIKQLGENNEIEFILCGSVEERRLCDQLIAMCPGVSIQNLAGKTDLLQMGEVLRGADLVVANESAAIHLASAVGTSSVCITGGGHYGRFIPYQVKVTNTRHIPLAAIHSMDCFGCRWVCPFEKSKLGAVPCISNIPVTDVVKKCQLLLNKI